MRLIDAAALLEAIANSGLIWETNECLDVIEILAVKKIIDNAPTITPEKALMDKLKDGEEELSALKTRIKILESQMSGLIVQTSDDER